MPRGEPVLLLLGTGVMLGATFPLGKAAALASIAPVVWAMVLAGGSSAMLFAARLARGRGIGVGPTRLRFYAIAATISLALPNLLVFAAIPHLGAGFTALAFTLSPVFTLALALALYLGGKRRAAPAGHAYLGRLTGVLLVIIYALYYCWLYLTL